MRIAKNRTHPGVRNRGTRRGMGKYGASLVLGVLVVACVPGARTTADDSVATTAADTCPRNCTIGNVPQTCDEVIAATNAAPEHACVLLKYAGCHCDGWVVFLYSVCNTGNNLLAVIDVCSSMLNIVCTDS